MEQLSSQNNPPEAQQQIPIQQQFRDRIDYIIENDPTRNNYGNSNLPGVNDPGIVGVSIRNIDAKLDNITIDSFENFKGKKENKEINDEELLKHLYFNETLQKVTAQINDQSGSLYFQNSQDFATLAQYLQAKTIELIKRVNGGDDLGQSKSPQFGKYINLQVDDICIEGTEQNCFQSQAIIKNKTTYTKQYGDNGYTKVTTPFNCAINCNFNAAKGFQTNIATSLKKQQIHEINKLGKKYEEETKDTVDKKWKIFFWILFVLALLSIIAGALGLAYWLKKKNQEKKEEEEQQKQEQAKKAEALDDHTNIKSEKDASIKYAQGENVIRTGKDSNGNKVSVVTDVNDIKYGKDLKVNNQLKDATELAAAGEVKNITANGKNYDVLNIDVTKGVDGAADKYKLTLANGTTKTFNQDQISSVKIGSKEYVGCLDTMENVDVQRSGNNTYFYYNTNDLEANLTTNNPTVTAYDTNGVAMLSTNATSEAGLSMLQQIYDDNPGVQYNARLNTLLGNNWYDKNGHLHDYKTGNLVENYEDKQINITDDINNNISSYYSGQTQRNSADHTNYGATEKCNDFTAKYGSNYSSKIENGNFSLYDNITTQNSNNTGSTYSLNNTYKDRTNALFA